MAIKNDFKIAVHPGQVLKEELNSRTLTQSALADHLGIHQSKINEICRGRRGISADMAFQLSKSFGTAPTFWMNLQSNWELSQVDKEKYRRINKLVA